MTLESSPRRLTVFEAGRQIAVGTDADIVAQLADRLAATDHPPVVIIDDASGRSIDIDLRTPPPAPERPGRGRLVWASWRGK